MIRASRRRFLRLAAIASLLTAHAAHGANNAINESGFVRIGDVDQWIAVQGENTGNPVILYLHGGPGEAQSPFLKEFVPWERDFTVVNWDQRGFGKTFGRNGSSVPLPTLDRLIDDVVEIAQHLQSRLSQRKVILVGQSWGSLLGVNVIKRRPELFHAFVGTGQVESFAATVDDQIRWARLQATAASDHTTLEAIDATLTLPPNRRLIAQAGAAKKYTLSPADAGYAKMVTDFMESGRFKTDGDASDWIAGSKFSGEKLGPVAVSMDLRDLGLDMPIPFFVIQGREDHIAGFEPAKRYTQDVRAPVKAFVAIDGGHYACFTHAAQFVAALRKYVRPLAV